MPENSRALLWIGPFLLGCAPMRGGSFGGVCSCLVLIEKEREAANLRVFVSVLLGCFVWGSVHLTGLGALWCWIMRNPSGHWENMVDLGRLWRPWIYLNMPDNARFCLRKLASGFRTLDCLQRQACQESATICQALQQTRGWNLLGQPHVVDLWNWQSMQAEIQSADITPQFGPGSSFYYTALFDTPEFRNQI